MGHANHMSWGEKRGRGEGLGEEKVRSTEKDPEKKEE